MKKKLIVLGFILNGIGLLFLAKAIWFPELNVFLKSTNWYDKISLAASKRNANLLENPDELSSEFVDELGNLEPTFLVSIPDTVGQKEEIIIAEPTSRFEYSGPLTEYNKGGILLLGDSQLECLKDVVHKRLTDNGYTLLANIIWYGSSSKQWGNTDTLEYYVHTYKPELVLIALGLNEVFVNDIDKRHDYLQKMRAKLDQLKVNYYLIGPAAWTEDKGIVQAMKEEFSPYFFESQNLVLDRAKDGRHPSKAGGEIWFDTVAKVLTQQHILSLDKVLDTTYRRGAKNIVLQVPKS